MLGADDLLLGFLRLIKADGVSLYELFRQQVDAASKLQSFFNKNADTTSAPDRLREGLEELKTDADRDPLLLTPDVQNPIWFERAVAREAKRRRRLDLILKEARSVLSSTRQRCYGARMVHPTPNLGFGLGQPTRNAQVGQIAYEYRTRFSKLFGEAQGEQSDVWRPRVTVTIDPVATASFTPSDDHIYIEAPVALMLMPRYRPTMCVEVGHWFTSRMLLEPPDRVWRAARTLTREVERLLARFHRPEQEKGWFAEALLHELTVDALSALVAGPGYAWAWLAQTLCVDPITEDEPRKVPHLVRGAGLARFVAPGMLATLFATSRQRILRVLEPKSRGRRAEYLVALSEAAVPYIDALRTEYEARASNLSGTRLPHHNASRHEPSSEPLPEWLDDPSELQRVLNLYEVQTDPSALDEPATLAEHLWVHGVHAFAPLRDELGGPSPSTRPSGEGDRERKMRMSDGRVSTAMTHTLQPRGTCTLSLRWLKPALRGGRPGILPPAAWNSAVVLGDYNYLLWKSARGSWDAADAFEETDHGQCFYHPEYLLSVAEGDGEFTLDATTLVTELRIHRGDEDFHPDPAAARKLRSQLLDQGALFASNGWGDAFLLSKIADVAALVDRVRWLWNLGHESVSRVVVPAADFEGIPDHFDARARPEIGFRVFVRVESAPGNKDRIDRAIESLDSRVRERAERVAGHDDFEIDVPLLDAAMPECFRLLRDTLRALADSRAVFTYDCRVHVRSTA